MASGPGKAAKEPWPAMAPSRDSGGYWNASKVCTKASSRILGKVLAELSNIPDLYSNEHMAPFRKPGLHQDDTDEMDMPEWANDVPDSLSKDSASDTEDRREQRVMWKKMKDRPGHHRRYQTRRQKRQPEAGSLAKHFAKSFCFPR